MMEFRTVSFQATWNQGSQLDSINRSSTSLEKREDERRSFLKACKAAQDSTTFMEVEMREGDLKYLHKPREASIYIVYKI